MISEAIGPPRRLGSLSGEAIAPCFGSVVDAVFGDLETAYDCESVHCRQAA
jgi:hypothetical protein